MAKKSNKTTPGLSDILKKLREIASYFDDEMEIDVEKSIEKLKEGSELLKLGRAELKEKENVFKEIEKSL